MALYLHGRADLEPFPKGCDARMRIHSPGDRVLPVFLRGESAYKSAIGIDDRGRGKRQ